MTTIGKNCIASLSDTDALAVLKPGVVLFNSPECPFKQIPEQFSQPPEVLAAYDAYKAISDAAHPNDSKQVVSERSNRRRIFNETMGTFMDFVLLASRKDPSLPGKFCLDFIGQARAKSARNGVQLHAVPALGLQVMDKDRGAVWCKVRGGVKKAVEIELTYDDPSNEDNWHHFDSFVNGSFSMGGLTSGRRAYVRGRYIFKQGKKGPWSEMSSIMVP